MQTLFKSLLVVSFAVLQTATWAQQQVVKIGHVAPLTGPIAHLGKDNENAARLAIEEINAKGLIIGGKPIQLELVAEDDASDPKRAVTIARKLVDAKVVGVIGHLNSGNTLLASPIYSDAGIPQISPSSTNPTYTRQGYKTAFRVVADDVQLGVTLGRYAVKYLKAKSIAIVDDRSAYGQGVAQEFEKSVKVVGGNLVGHEYTNDKTTDFTQLIKTLKAKKPDLVFIGGMDAVGGPLIKQLKAQGVGSKFMGGDGICTTELFKLSGETIVDGEVFCAEAGGVDGALKKGMDEFAAKYKKRFNQEIKLYAPYAYDAVNVMVDAMQRAKSTEPNKYLPELAKTAGYGGVSGMISFDPKGDIKFGAFTLFTYKGGQREIIGVLR